MPVIQLERPELKPDVQVIPVPTETEPRLQRILRRLHVGGASRDNCITVIENPSVDGKIGYLFASRFLETRHSKRFEETCYVRFNLNQSIIWEIHDFNVVYFQQGSFGPDGRLKYDYLRTENKILPNPTVMPYQICFLEPEVYNRHLESLKRWNNLKDVFGEINTTLAAKVRDFTIDPMTHKLILPENYASYDKIPI